MATTEGLLGMPVIALKKPHHEVELFNFALHHDCALVVSEQTSKSFICYQIINEYLQNESEKWAVVLIDDNSGLDMAPLIKMFNQLMPRKPIVFPNLNEAALLPHQENQDVVLMSTNNFNHCLTKGYMHANNISVVILLTTLKTIAIDHPTILTLCKEYAKPRIIGLVELDLHNIRNASDLKTQLDYLEAIYDLPIFMSKDVLAMNGYGEEIVVETVPFSPKNLSLIERNVWKLLNEISDFLQDMNISEVSKSIPKIRAVVLWAVEVLTMFGLWSFNFMLERIQNTLSGMLNKENNAFVALTIEACKTQFDLVQKLVNSQSKTPPVHSCLMYEIFDKLTPYQALCNTTTAEPGVENGEHEVGVNLPSEQKPCVADVETGQSTKFEEDSLADKSSLCESKEETGHSENNSSLYKESMRNNASVNIPAFPEKRLQKLRDKSQFYCIIVTRTNSFARMLSKLINYMSACNEKYNFMKSGCVIQSKNGSPEEEERTESVLQAVLQGMVNIVVTTVDLFSDLSLTTFNVLVYFGTPSSYEEYYQIKHKIKGLAPKLMLVFNDDRSEEMERNLQVFGGIESEIAKRVSDYITQENKEIWLRCLAEESPCIYMPFGENGPSVSMESSIYLINRYCRRINRGDFCNLYAQFMTEKKDLTENCVEFVSKLYLPLSSYCCSIAEGPPVQVNKGNDVDLEVGRLKSRMLASLECVKLLHSCGKMDDDLDLTEEQYVDNENLQNVELEDKTKGRAGTNKRKRAYEIKVPSFFEDNMPRANETCVLYKISFEDPTVYKHSRSGSLGSLSEPEFELGILSRKPLPKMPSFLVHTCKSDVSVSLEASDPIKIGETTLARIRLFHHYVFKELYKLDNQLTELCETDGYLAVPLVPNTQPSSPPSAPQPSSSPPRAPPSSAPQPPSSPPSSAPQTPPSSPPSAPPQPPSSPSSSSAPQTPSSSPRTTVPDNGFQIHYEFLQEFSTFFQTTTDPNVKLNSSPPCGDFSFFQSKIVRRANESANQTHYTRYFVVKVCEDLSPSSPFPDEEVAATFAEYYENRYGIQVNLQQPLLLVLHLPTQVNFIFPRHRHQTTEDLAVSSKGSKTEIHLIPDLCSILPLSASAWSLARYLPAVVYRLEAMLRAHEMKLKILFATGISEKASVEGKYGNGKLQSYGGDDDGGSDGGGDDGVGDDSGGGNDDDGVGDDGNGNNDDVGPSISLILHALTAKSVGQQFHSEQLELLGDSCLKLEVSLELFLTDPEKDEWALSIYRKHFVSNDMLSTQGRRLGIPGYISITLPDLTNTSLPPGFILEPSQGVKKKASLNRYTHQVLGDKHVANTVEALIAAALMGCGRDAARQFLIWLGVTQYTSSELGVLYQRLQAQTTGGRVNCTMSEERERMPGKKEQQDRNLTPWYVNENLNNATKSKAKFCEVLKSTNCVLQAHSTGDYGNCHGAINEEREMNVDLQAENGRSCCCNVKENLNKFGDRVKLHKQFGKELQTTNCTHLERKERKILKRLHVGGCNGISTLDVINMEEKEICNQSQITEQKHNCKPRTSGNLVDTKEDCGISLKNSKLPKNKINFTSSKAVPPKTDHPTRPVPNFDHIERELGYSFKNKHLLLQALTHNSYPRFLSQISETYQKMEFVGDAILDYVVTLYLYEHFPHLNHGDVTDFRSGLVNNFTLAFLAVQKNMHQSLRYMSPPLLDVIGQFLKFLEEQELKQGASWKTSVDAFVVGASEVEESLVEVPKLLGDVFEAVVCAVFLDSGMDLELVWKIFLPMFLPFIDYYKDNIPRSPIRVLSESFPDSDKVNFSLARPTLSRQYKSSVVVAGYGKFEAIGRTPKIAKASVARKALQHIRNEGTTKL